MATVGNVMEVWNFGAYVVEGEPKIWPNFEEKCIKCESRGKDLKRRAVKNVKPEKGGKF